MPDNTEVVENQQTRGDYITLSGRRKIYSSVEEVTKENVVKFVQDVFGAFSINRMEMEYLYWYRRGIQPILWREKKVNKYINNRIVTNLADEITIFKNGYFLTKPAFYVSRKESERKTKNVNTLNDYVYMSGKHKADNELVNWFHTVGVGVLYAEANKDNATADDCPFKVYALDPRSSFVVYSLAPDGHPIAGLNIVAISDTQIAIDVYTKTSIFQCLGGYRSVSDTTSHKELTITGLRGEPMVNTLGVIPIVEYVMNDTRMSCFESTIPLQNAINTIMSNAADGIEQFIQSLCVATNVQFDENVTSSDIRDTGILCLSSIDGAPVDFKILTQELNQSQTQVQINNLLDRINSIAGVPFSTNPQGGTSDNVGAVYLRSGYEIADTFVRDTEDCFRDSNRRFDEIMLSILRKVGKDMDLTIGDIDIQFSRSELENLQAKTQAAMNLKTLGLAPEVILEMTNLTNDPLSVIARSQKFIEQAWGMVEEKKEVVSQNTVGENVEGGDTEDGKSEDS